MRRAPTPAAVVTALATLCLPARGVAQRPAGPVMGSVATADARVAGGLQVAGGDARLISNASITALDHTAPVHLQRGGEVRVCSTSQFHLLHSGASDALLFGLDRGAMEIHGRATQEDVIMTPDLRFTMETGGTLNLSLRVTRNGDTCVDNAGANAPTMLLNDAFSAAVYRLTAGQHVLFEHGSLREVVDSESSPCGCPEPAAPARLTAGTAMTPAQRAAAEHPFPAAASQDLAGMPAPPVTATPDGQAHAQVSSTLVYTPGEPPPASSVPASLPVDLNPQPVAGSPAYAQANGTGGDAGPPPKTPPAPKDIFHAIGRFFHRVLHPGAEKKTPAASSR